MSLVIMNPFIIKTSTNDNYQTIDITDEMVTFDDMKNKINRPYAFVSDEQCKKDGVKRIMDIHFFDDDGHKISGYTSITGHTSIRVTFLDSIYRMSIGVGTFGVDNVTVPKYVNEVVIGYKYGQLLAYEEFIPLHKLDLPKSLNRLSVSFVVNMKISELPPLGYVGELFMSNCTFDRGIKLCESVESLTLSQCIGVDINLPKISNVASFVECTFSGSSIVFQEGLMKLNISRSSMLISENMPSTITHCCLMDVTGKKSHHISTPTGKINNWSTDLETLRLENIIINIPDEFPKKLKTLEISHCSSTDKLFPTEWPDSIVCLKLKWKWKYNINHSYKTFPEYWPRKCLQMEIKNMPCGTNLPTELPPLLKNFRSNDPKAIPKKWVDSLETIQCRIETNETFPDEWPSNVKQIRLNIHKDQQLPKILPDGLIKLDIKTSNYNHIPNEWPVSLNSIRVRVDTDSFFSRSCGLYIHRTDLEQYKSIGINITPQQLLMILLNVAEPDKQDYDPSSDDDYDYGCQCGYY